jgi:hypothetical protein
MCTGKGSIVGADCAVAGSNVDEEAAGDAGKHLLQHPLVLIDFCGVVEQTQRLAEGYDDIPPRRQLATAPVLLEAVHANPVDGERGDAQRADRKEEKADTATGSHVQCH